MHDFDPPQQDALKRLSQAHLQTGLCLTLQDQAKVAIVKQAV
jgi:hypothetical protein